MAIKAISITDEFYKNELEALEIEAELDNNRSPTKMATILWMEAIAARKEKREQDKK